MELIVKNTINFQDNDWQKTYECHIDNFSDFIDLIKSLEDDYGIMEDILCIEKNEDTGEISYTEYDNIKELSEGSKKEEFKKYTKYMFNSKDRHICFILDRKSSSLIINASEGSLGKKVYNPSKVKFYEDKYGNIVKFDENKQMLYSFDENLQKWVKRRELLSDFFSYDSEYELIDYDDNHELKR